MREPVMIEKHRPRIGIIGPLLGGHQDWVTSQGEVLAGVLRHAGYDVHTASHVKNRAARLADILLSLLRWGRKVDVILLMVFSGKAFIPVDASTLLARWLGKPLVLWFHGGNLPDFVKGHSVWAQRVFARGTAGVAPTGYLAEALKNLNPSITVIPNIIDIEQYPYVHRKSVQPRLMWMRTFHPIYNPLMAVSVLELLVNRHPDAMLTMAGQDKGLLPAVKDYARKLGLSDRIEYPGFLNQHAKLKAFRDHDIFLNTNHVDNMPVSVIEACASGLPVVATRVGGVPYLITDRQTGLLVGDDDANEMAAAVTALVADPNLAAGISANARLLAEKSSWRAVLPMWENLFQNLRN